VRPRPAEVTALYVQSVCGHFPSVKQWESSSPVRFCHDWQGRNADPARETELRLLWADDTIFLRFECHYRTIHIFPDSAPSGRCNQLWERDVTEVFLQPDRFGEKYYKEFEVAPNGLWLDLDIAPSGLRHIKSGMKSLVQIDHEQKVWNSQLAIPFESLTSTFDPAKSWRVNFFRCEGVEPERFYSAWQPTGTAEPNFHVPEKFGVLRWGR